MDHEMEEQIRQSSEDRVRDGHYERDLLSGVGQLRQTSTPRWGFRTELLERYKQRMWVIGVFPNEKSLMIMTTALGMRITKKERGVETVPAHGADRSPKQRSARGLQNLTTLATLTGINWQLP